MVKGADKADEAKALVRYLTEPKEQRVFAQNNHEFGVDSLADTTPKIKQFGDFKKDPIDVAGAGQASRRRRQDDELRRVALVSDPVSTAGRASRSWPPRWSPVRCWCCPPRSWWPPTRCRTSRDCCPTQLLATVYLLVGVGIGMLVLGTALGALVPSRDFPGRRWLEWAVVLPLAMPGYVFTLFALGARDDLGWTWLPLRSAAGAVAVFTLTLYPYVYLLARNAFLNQGAELVEAARGLGLTPRRAPSPASRCRSPGRRSWAAWRWR